MTTAKPKHLYNFAVGLTIRKNGEPWLIAPPITWPNVDDDGLAAMVGAATALESSIKKHRHKGGAFSVDLVSHIDSPTGGPIPAGANEPHTHDGLTNQSLVDIEVYGITLLMEIVRMGRHHADKKEGKRKGKNPEDAWGDVKAGDA